MKTQEEYAHEIDEIVLRDVKYNQNDWFNMDKEIFMLPANKNKSFILGTRETGCDLLILGGTNCYEYIVMVFILITASLMHGFALRMAELKPARVLR